MNPRSLAVCVVIGGACGGHNRTVDATDSPPPTCPLPVTEDGADHSSSAQKIAAPSTASGTTILVLGTPDAGGYASLAGYIDITELQPTQRVNVSLVMGAACTPACSPMVELRASSHPTQVLLGDDYNMGCSNGGSTQASAAGVLELLALNTNDGPNYGVLVQLQ